MGLTRPTVAQLNTVITEISDPVSLLNKSATLANIDIGFVLNRNGGASSNVAIFWNESTDSFNLAYTSSIGGTNSNVAVTGYANLVVGPVTSNGVTVLGGNITASGNLVIGGQGQFGGNLNVTGNILANNVTFNSVTASTLNVAGGGLNGVAIGQSTAAAGSFTTLTASSYINTTGNVLATAGVFNALTVNGNESVTGYLNVTGNVLATAGVFNALTVNGNESVTGYLNVTGNIISTGAIHNSLTVNGGITTTGFVNTTSNISASTVIAGAITTTGTATAASINSTGNLLATSGIFNALTVNGSTTITGNLYVQGNVTTISSNNIILEDSLIYLADSNPADLTDIGIVGSFTDAVRYQHTGLARDATDGQWKLFANVTTEPSTNVIDFTNASYSNLRVGNLTAVSANLSGTLTTSGNISTSGYLFGNGSTLTGVITSVTKIINGTSDITAYQDGNIAVSVGGTGNTVVFARPNVYVSGSIIPTANITYDLGSATNRFRSAYFSGSTIYLGNVAVSESTLAAIDSFPTGDYGDVSASSSDAFGVSTVATFDLNAAGSVTVIDLGELT